MEELEYITQKAIITCSEGSAPGLFTPTYNSTVKINGMVAATEIDKISIANIPSFIVCKKTKKECTPAPTVWENTYPVKVKGQQTLIGKSCIKCSVSGTIKFETSGQIPLNAEGEAELQNMRDGIKQAYDAEQAEKDRPWWKKAADFVVDCIPIVGPLVSMAKNISQGNWGMALLDAGFLALDVVGVVGAPFTGGGSLAASTVAKVGIRQTIKAGAKQVAKKMTKEAIEAGAKQTAEMLSKASVKSLTGGRLCVFACFPAGTQVATKDGLKNIEEIRMGDEVWAYDEITGEIGLKPVTNSFERQANVLVKIEIDGETITATPEHPFYANGEWKEAGLLETGDKIMLFSGRLAKVNEVKYEGAHAPVEISDDVFEDITEGYAEPQKVFNFEVEGWHTYFVGWLKALVHNAGGSVCNTAKKILKGEGKVGTYRNLIKKGKKGDNITPHHMPSDKYMKRKGVKRDDGISMNMEHPSPGTGGRHRKTKTNGSNQTDAERQAYYDLSPRDALAHDIKDARRIYMEEGRYTPEIRKGLQETIKQNKQSFPNLFGK
jgi:hypothetical protein